MIATEAGMNTGGPFRWRIAGILLLVFAGVEIALFAWLHALDVDAFMRFATKPDTAGYVNVARVLADEGRLIVGPRTLGYPLFLYPAFCLGGNEYGYHLVIAVQMALNLGLVLLFWCLMARLAPGVGIGFRVVVTAVFFVAGLSMASWVMSDFLAGFCLAVFLYGFLFKRSWPWVAVAGLALFWATYTRPTFTLFPIVVLVLALLMPRITSRLPWSHVVAYVAWGAAAVGASYVYDYRARDSVDAKSLVVIHANQILVKTVDRGRVDAKTRYLEFQKEIGARAGKSYQDMSRAERERIAKVLLIEGIKAAPGSFAREYARGFVKYMLVPIEGLVHRFYTERGKEDFYMRFLRPPITLAFFPIWLAALIPPWGSARRHRWYYVAAMIILVYVVGLSAMAQGAGERMRFPALFLFLPVAAINVEAAWLWIAGTTRRSRLAGTGAEGGDPPGVAMAARHDGILTRMLRPLTAATDKIHVQFMRYVLVGGVATAFDCGVLVMAVSGLKAHYLVGNAAGFVTGLVVNYVLSTKWVFAVRTVKSRTAEFAIFAVVGVVGLGLSELCMFLGVDVAGVHYMLAKLFAVMCTLVWNFGVRRALLFAAPRAGARSREEGR